MSSVIGRDYAVEYLTNRMNDNKAKGLMAQLDLIRGFGPKMKSVYRPGAWLFSPNVSESHALRVAVFPGKTLSRGLDDVESYLASTSKDYAFQRIARFMSDSGLVAYLSLPLLKHQGAVDNDAAVSHLEWLMFKLGDGSYEEDAAVFGSWPKKGRPTIKKRTWGQSTLERLQALDPSEIESMFINEAFYSDYLKGRMKVSTRDPYDVDGFLLSYDGRVFPLEVKEKSPGEGREKYFGLDAGRILMLLRLCLPTDTNALFIVKEVDDSDARAVIGWKYVTLSDIVSSAGWTLTKGGVGMTGGATQTVIIPYTSFLDLGGVTPTTLSDIRNISDETKVRAKEFLNKLEAWLSEGRSNSLF